MHVMISLKYLDLPYSLNENGRISDSKSPQSNDKNEFHNCSASHFMSSKYYKLYSLRMITSVCIACCFSAFNWPARTKRSTAGIYIGKLAMPSYLCVTSFVENIILYTFQFQKHSQNILVKRLPMQPQAVHRFCGHMLQPLCWKPLGWGSVEDVSIIHFVYLLSSQSPLVTHTYYHHLWRTNQIPLQWLQWYVVGCDQFLLTSLWPEVLEMVIESWWFLS